MTADRHRDRLRDAGAYQVTDAGAAEVVKEAAWEPGGLAGVRPRLAWMGSPSRWKMSWQSRTEGPGAAASTAPCCRSACPSPIWRACRWPRRA